MTDEGIFAALIGWDGAKAILRKAIREGGVHVLLEGPPASGKSVVLDAIEEHVPGATYHDAKGFTEVELRDVFAEDPDILLLDEIDAMGGDAYEAMSVPMEKGVVTKDTAHRSYRKEVDVQVIAACNNADDLPSHTNSRFRTVTFSAYDEDEFLAVCQRLLKAATDWVRSDETAHAVAQAVYEQTGTRDPRDVRDVASLADSVDEARDLAAALSDPRADVQSEPLRADELVGDGGRLGEQTMTERKAEPGHVGLQSGDTPTVVRQEDGSMVRPPTESEMDDIEETWAEFSDGGQVTEAVGMGGDDDGSEDADEPAESDASADVGGDGDVWIEVDESEANRVQARTNATLEKKEEADQNERVEDFVTLSRSDNLALRVHHTDEDHDELHRIFAEIIGEDPGALYDHSKESDREGFDLQYPWQLKREGEQSPWSPTKWQVEELIDHIEDAGIGPVMIESGVYDLT